jgi:hypothetical protein
MAETTENKENWYFFFAITLWTYTSHFGSQIWPVFGYQQSDEQRKN